MSTKYIAKGIATHEGKTFEVYLDWSDEGGGWYQWRSSRSWAKLFDTEKEAIRAAKECTGPWFNKPERSTIAVEAVESPPSITSLESQLADALAANQVMREALAKAYDVLRNNDNSMMALNIISEGQIIKTGDVTLIHIGNYCVEDTLHGVDLLRTDINPGSMVYAIQTKE
jgi:hypothetical protein